MENGKENENSYRGFKYTFSWMFDRMLIHLLKLSFCFTARVAEAATWQVAPVTTGCLHMRVRSVTGKLSLTWIEVSNYRDQDHRSPTRNSKLLYAMSRTATQDKAVEENCFRHGPNCHETVKPSKPKAFSLPRTPEKSSLVLLANALSVTDLNVHVSSGFGSADFMPQRFNESLSSRIEAIL